MGIVLKLKCDVKSFDGKQVFLDDGSLIDTCTVIWAAGLTGALPKGVVASLLERGDRMRVDRYIDRILWERQLRLSGKFSKLLLKNGH